MSKWIIAAIAIQAIGVYYGFAVFTAWILKKWAEKAGDEQTPGADAFFACVWPFTWVVLAVYVPCYALWLAVKKTTEMLK